jgi:penicillin-binding protein 1C
MHHRVRIDTRNGLRAGVACPPSFVEERTFERFESRLSDWARSVGRSVAPPSFSPLCPAGPSDAKDREPRGRLRIAFPEDGARFTLDPAASGKQSIRIRVEAPAGVADIRLVLDGQPRVIKNAPFGVDWPLLPGEHRLRVDADGVEGDGVEFSVE